MSGNYVQAFLGDQATQTIAAALTGIGELLSDPNASAEETASAVADLNMIHQQVLTCAAQRLNSTGEDPAQFAETLGFDLTHLTMHAYYLTLNQD